MADDAPFPARTGLAYWRSMPAWIVPAMLAGIVGVVLSIVLPFDFFVHLVPFVVVTSLTAFGFLALLWILERRLAQPLGDGLIVALVPYLAWPFLLRMAAIQLGARPPAQLMIGTLVEFATLALGIGLFAMVAARRPGSPEARARGALWAGTVGAVVVGLLVALVIVTSERRTGAGLFLFGLTVVVVTSALLVQWSAVRFGPLRNRPWLATGPALAVAGTQLFDGVVTYLAVVDPFGMAPSEFQENMPLSSVILTYTQIGYPILKWALAIMIAYALDGRATEARRSSVSRLAVYLTLAVVGMGPALFSGTQLL